MIVHVAAHHRVVGRLDVKDRVLHLWLHNFREDPTIRLSYWANVLILHRPMIVEVVLEVLRAAQLHLLSEAGVDVGLRPGDALLD